MDESAFKLNILSLERLYGHKLDVTVFKMYFNALHGIPDSEFHTIVQGVVKSFVPSAQVPFPAIATFLKLKREQCHRPAQKYLVDSSDLPDENFMAEWRNSWPSYLRREIEQAHVNA